MVIKLIILMMKEFIIQSEKNGYKVPFFLSDDDKANSAKYTLTYFSGENSDSFEQTISDTVDTIKVLNKEYKPTNENE